MLPVSQHTPNKIEKSPVLLLKQEREPLTGKLSSLWVWMALIMFCSLVVKSCWVWWNPLIFWFPSNDSIGTGLPLNVSCYLYKTVISLQIAMYWVQHQSNRHSKLPLQGTCTECKTSTHSCLILVQLHSQDLINFYSSQGAAHPSTGTLEVRASTCEIEENTNI